MDASAHKWRKRDGENCPTSVSFVNQLTLVPARYLLLYDVGSDETRSWTLTAD